MRVLAVTTNLAGPTNDGTSAAGNAWRLVLTALGERASVDVLAPRIASAPDTERMGDLVVRRVGPPRPEASLEDALRGPAALGVARTTAALWRETRRALSSGRYDLVHALWAFPAGWAATHPRSPVPVLLSCPGSDLHRWAALRIAGAPIRAAVRRADLVAPMSTDGIAQALGAGARRAEPIPVCFDPQVFGVNPDRPIDPVIAYTGRLTRTKGIFVLADALERLASRLPGIRFVCCGTGPDADDFTDRIRGILGEQATFHGAVPPHRVARILADARVAVLPSFGEGMSAAAIEALAVGRPLVSSATGEHAEIVRRGGGRVVEPGDGEGLAWALEAELATDRDPAVLRALAEPYTPRRVADHVLDLYASLIPAAVTVS